MNPWPFVIAAYSITAIGAVALCVLSWRWMIRAESKADSLRKDR